MKVLWVFFVQQDFHSPVMGAFQHARFSLLINMSMIIPEYELISVFIQFWPLEM